MLKLSKDFFNQLNKTSQYSWQEDERECLNTFITIMINFIVPSPPPLKTRKLAICIYQPKRFFVLILLFSFYNAMFNLPVYFSRIVIPFCFFPFLYKNIPIWLWMVITILVYYLPSYFWSPSPKQNIFKMTFMNVGWFYAIFFTSIIILLTLK